MANLAPLGFNPAEVEDMGDGFKVIAPGFYNVVIVESAVNDTKNGSGKVLELKYQITDGPQTGSVLVDRINIQNASDKAQRIGLSQLKNICDAIGFVGLLNDSAQLHGKPFAVKVIVEQFESNKEPGKMLDSNRVEKRMSRTKAQEAAIPAPLLEPAAKKQAMGW